MREEAEEMLGGDNKGHLCRKRNLNFIMESRVKYQSIR